VVFADGAAGITGAVTPGNALVGTTTNDRISSYGVTALANGNYLVKSADWANGAAANAGALSFGSGTTGVTGAVSAANSLVGTHAGSLIGLNVHELQNGHYVTASSSWRNASAIGLGAVTWGDGINGTTGAVTGTNSLVGSTAQDQVGSRVVPLANGHYVVGSPGFGATDTGAVTWCDGAGGCSGILSAANSMLGSQPAEGLGLGLFALRDRADYVVANAGWDDGAIVDVGAVKQFDGTSALTGVFSASGALTGSSAGDRVGDCTLGACLRALAGGWYAVFSPDWNDGGIADVGAVTWMDPDAPKSGIVSGSNSLIGGSAGDRVGFASESNAYLLGDYTVVQSQGFDHGAATDAGAVTLLRAGSDVTGPLSTANSLLGSSVSDQVGYAGINLGPESTIRYLTVDRFAVRHLRWDNGAIVDAGAVTLASTDMPLADTIHAGNSVLGTVANGAQDMTLAFDRARDQLAVGRPGSNLVTLLDFRLFAEGFE
jgi:hypothetical protein